MSHPSLLRRQPDLQQPASPGAGEEVAGAPRVDVETTDPGRGDPGVERLPGDASVRAAPDPLAKGPQIQGGGLEEIDSQHGGRGAAAGSPGDPFPGDAVVEAPPDLSPLFGHEVVEPRGPGIGNQSGRLRGADVFPALPLVRAADQASVDREGKDRVRAQRRDEHLADLVGRVRILSGKGVDLVPGPAAVAAAIEPIVSTGEEDSRPPGMEGEGPECFRLDPFPAGTPVRAPEGAVEAAGEEDSLAQGM